MKKQELLLILVVIAFLICGIVIFYWKKAPLVSEHVAQTEARPKSVAPAASQNQSSFPESAVVRPRRSFSDLSVKERKVVLDEINRADLDIVFQTWIESGRSEHDLMKQQSIGWEVRGILRKRPPNPRLFMQMQEFIADASNSTLERAQLLSVLGYAGTKESLDVLLQVATAMPENEVRQLASKAVGYAGVDRWNGRFHEELAPALERVWQQSQDPYLLASVAVAMANVGAPSSVDLLLSSAIGAGSATDIRASAAKGALSEIKNPNAVPVLAAVLEKELPTSEASTIASGTLANMIDPESAKALLNWLQSADESAADLARRYVSRTQAPAQLAAWESALNPAVPFRSEKIREAIRTGLAEYHQDHR